MRKPLIAGNWKMNKTPSEAKTFAEQLKSSQMSQNVEVLVCPPFTALCKVIKVLKGTNIKVGAQNMHWETKGAYTGEISAEFLLDAGCQYVILGHSERRQYFGETDETVNKKMLTALKVGLKPIMCVGEHLSEREAGKTFEVIKRQIEGGLANITSLENVVIAYEPVWAIGTGKTATPEQADEVHAFVRENISKKYGNETANQIRILYGGSVTPENVDNLMAKPNIDGALVGGASLKLDAFLRLINFTPK